MEVIFRVTLVVAGLINFAPSLLAFFPGRIAKAYGIADPDASLSLLLQHRAVLFGIVGGLLLFSAFTKKYYDLSTIIGLVSMVSFLILYFIIGGNISKELTRVMQIDLFAIIVLVVGYALHRLG